MLTVRLKPVALRIHRWIGLGLSLWILMVALTGSILAFRAPLEVFLHPRFFLVRDGALPGRFDLMVSAVGARYPDRQIIGFARDGLRPDESFQVILTDEPGPGRRVDRQAPGFNPVRDASLEVFVHPRTGAILGARPFWSPMRVIYWLHKELLAPFVGAPYLGVLGLALLALLAAGFVYWWPKAGQYRRAFRVQTGRGARRLIHDLHAAGGAATGVLLLVSAATGVFMCYEVKIEGVLKHLGLATAQPPIELSTADGGPEITVQDAVNLAQRAYPAFDPVLVNLPIGRSGAYGLQLFPRTASRVWWTVEIGIDPFTGKTVSLFDPGRQRAGDSLPLWVIFLHNGQMLGGVGRVVVLGEGLVLAMLVLTGPWLWWVRRRSARRPAARQSP
jgi:uncharacterized iron-regulated membrane protein